MKTNEETNDNENESKYVKEIKEETLNEVENLKKIEDIQNKLTDLKNKTKEALKKENINLAVKFISSAIKLCDQDSSFDLKKQELYFERVKLLAKLENGTPLYFKSLEQLISLFKWYNTNKNIQETETQKTVHKQLILLVKESLDDFLAKKSKEIHACWFEFLKIKSCDGEQLVLVLLEYLEKYGDDDTKTMVLGFRLSQYEKNKESPFAGDIDVLLYYQAWNNFQLGKYLAVLQNYKNIIGLKDKLKNKSHIPQVLKDWEPTDLWNKCMKDVKRLQEVILTTVSNDNPIDKKIEVAFVLYVDLLLNLNESWTEDELKYLTEINEALKSEQKWLSIALLKAENPEELLKNLIDIFNKKIDEAAREIKKIGVENEVFEQHISTIVHKGKELFWIQSKKEVESSVKAEIQKKLLEQAKFLFSFIKSELKNTDQPILLFIKDILPNLVELKENKDENSIELSENEDKNSVSSKKNTEIDELWNQIQKFLEEELDKTKISKDSSVSKTKRMYQYRYYRTISLLNILQYHLDVEEAKILFQKKQNFLNEILNDISNPLSYLEKLIDDGVISNKDEAAKTFLLKLQLKNDDEKKETEGKKKNISKNDIAKHYIKIASKLLSQEELVDECLRRSLSAGIHTEEGILYWHQALLSLPKVKLTEELLTRTLKVLEETSSPLIYLERLIDDGVISNKDEAAINFFLNYDKKEIGDRKEIFNRYVKIASKLLSEEERIKEYLVKSSFALSDTEEKAFYWKQALLLLSKVKLTDEFLMFALGILEGECYQIERYYTQGEGQKAKALTTTTEFMMRKLLKISSVANSKLLNKFYEKLKKTSEKVYKVNTEASRGYYIVATICVEQNPEKLYQLRLDRAAQHMDGKKFPWNAVLLYLELIKELSEKNEFTQEKQIKVFSLLADALMIDFEHRVEQYKKETENITDVTQLRSEIGRVFSTFETAWRILLKEIHSQENGELNKLTKAFMIKFDENFGLNEKLLSTKKFFSYIEYLSCDLIDLDKLISRLQALSETSIEKFDESIYEEASDLIEYLLCRDDFKNDNRREECKNQLPSIFEKLKQQYGNQELHKKWGLFGGGKGADMTVVKDLQSKAKNILR